MFAFWFQTFLKFILKFHIFSWLSSDWVNSTIWSHDGQKDRFVIFGRGAPKMGEKSWRETIGVKVRSEILSPGQNFPFRPIWYDVPAWWPSECPAPSLHFCFTVPLRHFWFVSEFYPRIFYPFWAPQQPKITNRSFWLSCDQTVLLTGVRPKPEFSPFDRRATFPYLGTFDQWCD